MNKVFERGWPDSENAYLSPSGARESGWNIYSGEPGLRRLRDSASAAQQQDGQRQTDWRTNPATQIAWGEDYIKANYGTPCNALAHSNAFGWY